MIEFRTRILTSVVEKLSLATTLPMITRTVASAARALTGADGATFVLREGGLCFYADEDAVAPLWKGLRFPLESCISGWAMENREVVLIENIYKDSRIPHDAYRPTFVKSLCMVPVRAADPIAAIGNYWSTGYIPTKEEIQLLQILANSAAIALENYYLREKLHKQNAKIEESSSLEAYFETVIHTIAHDLRNPLSTMMLFAEMLQANLAGQIDEKNKDYIASILKTGGHANEQIHKMLSLYSVKDARLEKKKINMSSMAYNIFQNIRARTPDRKVSFEIEPDLSAVADPHLIHLALENLISNAYKYTGKKQAAEIQFRKLSHSQFSKTFFIRDNGDGFDAEDGIKLFQPRVRLHESSDFPGTGLGLASVARIIELHGGNVRAEGRKSHGATFYFELPE